MHRRIPTSICSAFRPVPSCLGGHLHIKYDRELTSFSVELKKTKRFFKYSKDDCKLSRARCWTFVITGLQRASNQRSFHHLRWSGHSACASLRRPVDSPFLTHFTHLAVVRSFIAVHGLNHNKITTAVIRSLADTTNGFQSLLGATLPCVSRARNLRLEPAGVADPHNCWFTSPVSAATCVSVWQGDNLVLRVLVNKSHTRVTPQLDF